MATISLNQVTPQAMLLGLLLAAHVIGTVTPRLASHHLRRDGLERFIPDPRPVNVTTTLEGQLLASFRAGTDFVACVDGQGNLRSLPGVGTDRSACGRAVMTNGVGLTINGQAYTVGETLQAQPLRTSVNASADQASIDSIGRWLLWSIGSTHHREFGVDLGSSRDIGGYPGSDGKYSVLPLLALAKTAQAVDVYLWLQAPPRGRLM